VRLVATLVCLALAAAVGALLAAPAAAAPPIASFAVSPPNPVAFDQVTFTSTSFDPDGDPIDETQWDIDGPADFEVTGVTASRSYSRANSYLVRLRVVAGGDVTTLDGVVDVGNRPPEASIAAIPSTPIAGQEVTFVSTSTDRDGAVGGQSWDLDGDGFDDGSDVYVTKRFPAPGRYSVRLQVTDREDPPASSIAEAVVIVTPLGGQIIGASSVRLMSPFPVVRISGVVRRLGTRLRLLSVSAPVGASVQFRCQGRGCPFKRRTRPVERPRSTSRRNTSVGQVRFQRFRRTLRVGTTVKVLVTKPGSIGKYTRFRIRRGRLPARRDLCLLAVGAKPIPCPSG
jgi:PKD repeat protein